MALLIKTINGLAYGSVKTKNGLSTASIKTINGLDATGFVPTDIAGCIWWIAADNIVGLSDGDPVSTWNDESGNSIDVTQATGSLQPSYQTNELNGLPIVRFDGGDSLTGSSATLLALARTVFVVANQTLATGEDCIFDVGNFMAITADGSSWKWYGNTSTAFTGPNLAWSVVSVPQDNSTGGDVYVDGVSVQSLGNSASGGGTGVVTIGSANGPSLHFTGDIAEIIIYDTKLSSTDRQTVENYLFSKYGL